MSVFFYLFAFYCWVRYRDTQISNFRHRTFYISSVLAFVAGILSKEAAITLPIMLWLYDIYFFKESKIGSNVQERQKWRLNAIFLNWRTYLSYIPFILLVIIPYLIMRGSSFGRILPGSKRDILTQSFTQFTVLFKYLKMSFLPVSLSPF